MGMRYTKYMNLGKAKALGQGGYAKTGGEGGKAATRKGGGRDVGSQELAGVGGCGSAGFPSVFLLLCMLLRQF